MFIDKLGVVNYSAIFGHRPDHRLVNPYQFLFIEAEGPEVDEDPASLSEPLPESLHVGPHARAVRDVEAE